MVAHIADHNIQNHIIALASTMAYARGGWTDVRPPGDGTAAQDSCFEIEDEGRNTSLVFEFCKHVPDKVALFISDIRCKTALTFCSSSVECWR